MPATDTQLIALRDQISALIAPAQPATQPASPPPPAASPPPPSPSASAPAAMVIAPDNTVLTDSRGARINFGRAFYDYGYWGHYIVVNGVETAIVAALMVFDGGEIKFLSSNQAWSKYDGSKIVACAKPGVNTASPEGYSIHTTDQFIFDAAGDCFFLASVPGQYGAGVYVNDQVQGSIGTMTLTSVGGFVVSTDANGMKKKWVGSAWAPFDGVAAPPAAAPATATTTPPVLVTPTTPPASGATLNWTLPSPLVGMPALSALEKAAGLPATFDFFDHFDDASTVDTGMTLDPTKKWFVNSGDATSAGGISCQNGWLVMTQDNTPNGGGFNLRSQAFRYPIIDANKSKYSMPPVLSRDLIGYCIPPGKVHSIVGRYSCDPAGAADFPRSWPADWTLSAEQLLIGLGMWVSNSCTIPNMVNHHVEIDYFEIMPGGASPPYVDRLLCSTRMWFTGGQPPGGTAPTYDGGYPNCTWQNQGEGDFGLNNVVANNTLPFDIHDFTMACTVTPAIANGGNGSITWEFDGKHYPEVDKKWKTGDGCFLNLLDTQHCHIILGCGNHDGMAVDYRGVRVKP